MKKLVPSRWRMAPSWARIWRANWEENVKAEAGGAGAHGDGGGLVQEAGLEAAPDGGGKSGTEIAHTDAEAAVMFAGSELAGGVGFGIVEGVDAEIVDDAIEQVAVGEGEAGFVVVGGGEGAVVTLVERGELGEDLVAETADADRSETNSPSSRRAILARSLTWRRARSETVTIC